MSGKSDNWLTPLELLQKLTPSGARPFDLDPAAAPAEVRASFWPTAAEHYTMREDGLIMPWRGRIFLNPPYSHGLIQLFMRKAAEFMCAGGRGMAIVNARVETDWYQDLVFPIATALFYPRYRIKFISQEGPTKGHHGFNPQVIVAYGWQDAEILVALKERMDGHVEFLALPRLIVVSAIAAAGLPTWRELLRDIVGTRGMVRLEDVYRRLAAHPKATGNPNWQAKARQVLQGPDFERVDRGTYRLAGVA